MRNVNMILTIYFFSSEFFKKALTTEVGEKKNEMMEVKEFSHDVLSTAVDFMYGKDIPLEFTNPKDLEGLLQLADQYLMSDLKDAAGSRIGGSLTKENIIETSKLAELFTSDHLSDACAEFIIKNKEAVADEDMDKLGGTVLGALGKKAMKELKSSWSWVPKLWGEKMEFKNRKDFTNTEDYKGYVMARVQPKMLVRCNQESTWRDDDGKHALTVGVGEIGCVEAIEFRSILVKWIGVKDGYFGKPTPRLGHFENLDLLTLPVKFSC